MAYVVVGKNPEKNQLIVGWDQADTPGLYVKRCTVGTVSWTNKAITSSMQGGGAAKIPRQERTGDGNTYR